MQTLLVASGASLAAALALATPAFQDRDDALAFERDLARHRYARVASELSARDVSALSNEQREARAELLAVLDAYRTAADFGIDREHPGSRVPLFVDGDGRRCAMAELLHATGRNDLVAAVHASNNQAWVVDLAESDPFLDWLDVHGLALDEAARIQGPTMGGIPVEEGPVETPVFRATSGPLARRTSAPSGSITGVGGPSTPGGRASTPGRAAQDGALTRSEDSAAWWLWWEFNKIEFLRPNRALRAVGDDVATATSTATSYVAFVRRVMLPAVVRALADGDPQVRGTAALTLGRIGGAEAFEPLLELVQDANTSVREMAILGLGASGAPRAAEFLIALARDARMPDASSRSQGRNLQALAIVALGIGRKAGFDASVDAAVVELVESRSQPEREPVGLAAGMYATLAPSDAMRALARELATDASEPITVRCRAIEALRSASDAATLSKLQHLLSSARVELRRSAALALGEVRHPLVVPALQTACDLEKDQLTRSFLVVALGRQGGSAREYLLKELREGPRVLRPWTALALGLAGHGKADETIARALRDAVVAEKNSDARAAYWLASGLVGDSQALATIRAALASDAAPRNRMYAAQALALIGGDAAHSALLERVPNERSEIARSQVALALGVLGRESDAGSIADVLAATSDPMLQGQVSSAMAFLGSSEAVSRLSSWIASDELARATRAAALDGLGMVLGTCEPLALGEVARSSNFTLFAPWTVSMLATTL